MPTLALTLLAGCIWITDAEHAARTAIDPGGCEDPSGCDRDGDGALDADDCAPDDPAVFPGADEVCDGADDDCDGTVDEDPVDGKIFYSDSDSDGYGADDLTATACEAPDGYAEQGDDCDESDAGVNPGADEVCDGVDNDCDGAIDLGAIDGQTFYVDADRDDYGADETIACAYGDGLASAGGDCDDSDPSVFPGAPELCDGRQTDCDQAWSSDEGVISFYDAGTKLHTALDTTRGATEPFELGAPGALSICEGIYTARFEISADVEVTGKGSEQSVVGGASEGAVFEIFDADVSISGLSITDGYDPTGGGGIHAAYSNLSLRNVAVFDNISDGEGAGIHLDATDGAFIEVSIFDNYAVGNGGGLTIVNGGSAELSESEVEQNGSEENGAGVSLNNSAFTCIDSEIHENTSTDNGGGLAADDGAEIELSSCTFLGNSGASGGAISVRASSMTMTDGSLYQNQAESDGGGIALFSGGTAVGEAVSFQDNEPDDIHVSSANESNYMDGRSVVFSCDDGGCTIATK